MISRIVYRPKIESLNNMKGQIRSAMQLQTTLQTVSQLCHSCGMSIHWLPQLPALAACIAGLSSPLVESITEVLNADIFNAIPPLIIQTLEDPDMCVSP